MAKQKTQVFDKVIEVPFKKKGQILQRKLRVIVLRETDEAIVYIPMNGISRVDYERLKKLYDTSELDLLTTLRDERLDNGRNALVTYKDIICTLDKRPPAPLVSDVVPEPADTGETGQPQPVEGQFWEGEPPPGWVRETDGTIRPRKKPGPKPKTETKG